MKRTLAALAALLAAGITLALPVAWTERGTPRPVTAVETAASVPETDHATAAPHDRAGAGAGGAPRWERRLTKLVAGVPMSVAVEEGGQPLFRFRPATPRVPASNEKLLLSMAILDALGPGGRITTYARTARVSHDVVRGDLWLEGGGDPTVTSADLARLAERIKAAGVRRITGSVLGSVEPFAHDWNAPGWKPRFRREEVGLPTALTFDRNTIRGRHIRHPERFAAASLAMHLRKLHVRIDHATGAGHPPAHPRQNVATISSPPLMEILHAQDVDSINFYAEVLNKLLGYTASGAGTIAAGAGAIQSWAAANGVELEAHDGSGLSYANRVSAEGIVDLLEGAENEPWGPKLRSALPHAGQGTLRGRLAGIKLHAKTGTLHIASALSGWVWVHHDRTWAPFSILIGDIPTDRAIALEDQIVRMLARNARLPEV